MKVLSRTPNNKQQLWSKRGLLERLKTLTSPLASIISLLVFLACPVITAALPNYRLAWPDPSPISAAVGSTGTTAAPIFYYQGTGVPPGGPAVFPDVITWSISDVSVAKLANCSASSCTIVGLSPGNALLYADSHSELLGLDQRQIKTIVITETPSPSNSCADQTAESVSCGGDCTATGIRGSIQRVPSSELVAALFKPAVWDRDEFHLTSSPIAAAFRSMSAVQNSVFTIPINLSCNPQGGTIEIITSGDPNEKVGATGAGTGQYISGATPLRYAVLFSNLSTATASAQDVFISDPLDLANDDLTTLNMGPISFGTQLVLPPVGLTDYTTVVDLRPANSLLVKVSEHLDVSKGLLTWSFTSLDPSTNLPPTDPTAGFLPPGGEGSVFFTVMPKTGIATDTQIQNQATITFDVNPAMSTQTWLNTIDNAPPNSQVIALPATEPVAGFTVTWSGTDVGAGIQDFTIFVSDNGGPFTSFQTNTTATSATFTGQVGHTYGFYSIARDLVGNMEAAKTAAEATTLVASDTVPPTTTASASPGPNANGWNNSDVTITLTSLDNPGGTGVEEITYSASGAQSIAGTTAQGATASITVSTEGATTITFFATDNAGNVETAKTLTVKLDKTPPSILSALAPPLNVSGWTNTDVTVSFTCTDALSGLAAGSPPTPTTLSAEGANQSVSGTCQDLAGNTASATISGINIDKTPPSITPSRVPAPNANGWNNTNVTVSFACADTLSGLAAGSPPAPTVLSSEGANQQVAGSCTDLAGNSASAMASGINIDKTPPVLDGLPPANCTLWPPDKRFVTVATISAQDALSGLTSLSVTGASSEPMDPQNPDIIISGTGPGPRAVQLRADRLGTGTGRVYTITSTATDAAGNIVNNVSACTVPHDQRSAAN